MPLLKHSAVLVILIFLSGAAWSQAHPIDTANSRLTVHAFKSGLFSGFADNHEIEAPISDGSIDESSSLVTLVVDSRRMKVLDPQLSDDKRRQVQERMLGPEVLDSERFPKISFESTKVERTGQTQFLVEGQLYLHGVTHPIAIKVRSDNGHYLGSCTLKQRDFGIEPISIVGGTVKVKDELKIDFDIRIRHVPVLVHPSY